MRWIDLANVGKDCDGLMKTVLGELSSTVGHIFEREETKGLE